MKVIFICGPFNAGNAWAVEQNVRKAEALQLEVWRLGAAAICPHASSRYFLGALPEKNFEDGYREILKRCDAILLIPGWENSKGSWKEVGEAKQSNKPIFETLKKLERWLRKR